MQTDTQAPVPPDKILQIGSAFFASRVLLCAIGLGLFTELAEGELDAESLRIRLGLNERSARDFFDALVALRLLDRIGGRYRNTETTRYYLDRAKPSYIGAWFEMADRRLFRIWGDLTSALKTGKPQNEFGEDDPFDAIYSNGKSLESFAREMTAVTIPIAQGLLRHFPWERYKSFVDIGTMQGALPVLLAKARPHLKGGGFDLPPVGPVFYKYVKAEGLSGRLIFYPGDFRKDLLPPAEVLIMGHVLVDWGPAMKRHLLKQAYAALPEGGALIIYDMIVDDQRCTNAMALLMSLNMLLETAEGGEYTASECRSWMHEAGFTHTSLTPLAASHSMVVGIK